MKYKKVGVLPIWIVKSNISSIGPLSERNGFLSDETKGQCLKHDTILSILAFGSTPTFLYFNLFSTYRLAFMDHSFVSAYTFIRIIQALFPLVQGRPLPFSISFCPVHLHLEVLLLPSPLSLHHTIFFPVSLFFFFTAVLSSLYFSLYILLFPYHVNTTLVRYSLPLIQSPPLWPKLLLTPSLFILSFKVTPLILRLGILIDAVSNKL